MSIEENIVNQAENNPELSTELNENQAVESEVQETQTSELPEAENQSAEEVPIEAPETLTPEELEAKRALLEKYTALFNEVVNAKENNTAIEIEITDRIKGGLRATYDILPLFLPASHFSLKRTPTEEELKSSIGTKVLANVHEIQDHGDGRKAVIVSRKKILVEEFWNTIKIGDIVEGRVSSISTFGVFLDLGGMEGLIHISRLSQVRVEDPKKIYKKGDVLKAVVIELNKEKNRIALSRKELEESPWKNIENEIKPNDIIKGVVRRISDFGAYIEIKPGIDGLLRTSEISWTKRVNNPKDVLKIGDEIELRVINVSSEKQTLSLSLKRVNENPWESIAEKYPVNSSYEGVIKNIVPQGMIISINDELDGFLPKSKMRYNSILNKPEYNIGDKLEIVIADLIPAEESLILAPKYTDEELEIIEKEEQARKEARANKPNKEFKKDKDNQRRDRKPREQKEKKSDNFALPSQSTGIFLGDLLKDLDKKNLY